MDIIISRCFTSNELRLCLGSSLSRAPLDCRSQMISEACFMKDGEYRCQVGDGDHGKLYCDGSTIQKRV
jgi:hypothetical protein